MKLRRQPIPGKPNIQIPTVDLQMLFDIAVNSMDFGSGFLDKEEVDTLRRIAVLLDVDPIEGTPSAVAADYKHAYKEAPNKRPGCVHCNLGLTNEVHGGQ